MARESMLSSASFVTNGFVRRRKHVSCYYGVEAPVVTTSMNENDNIGRRFYGCGRFKESNKRVCEYFVWYDEVEGSPRDKKVIAGLLGKIEGMKKKQVVLIKLCVAGWSLVAFVPLLFCVILTMKMMK